MKGEVREVEGGDAVSGDQKAGNVVRSGDRLLDGR